ncbi:MAG TPA: FixH family protein [Longimicrobiaceae bacterium]|nr:FixH family protein [Longimicrobiaceae bacterium]
MTAYTKGTRGAHGWKRAAGLAAAALGIMFLGACTQLMMMMHGDVEPPPASEFGFGPRRSSGGLYEATIEPAEPLRTRRLHTVRLSIRAAGERPVEGASIAVDGGMPQHGHGLPTRPRVTRSLGDGTYQVDGVKFNMGGWWELKFRIDSEAGTDSVTFNLEL